MSEDAVGAVAPVRLHLEAVELVENDANPSNWNPGIASTLYIYRLCQFQLLGVPSLKSASPGSRPVNGCHSYLSWAFAFERRPLTHFFSRALVSLQVWCTAGAFTFSASICAHSLCQNHQRHTLRGAPIVALTLRGVRGCVLTPAGRSFDLERPRGPRFDQAYPF